MKVGIARGLLYSLGIRIDRIDLVTRAPQLPVYGISRLLKIPRDAGDGNVLLAKKLSDLFWYLRHNWTLQVFRYFRKAAISNVTSFWLPTNKWPPLG